jgi:hypothetical protein
MATRKNDVFLGLVRNSFMGQLQCKDDEGMTRLGNKCESESSDYLSQIRYDGKCLWGIQIGVGSGCEISENRGDCEANAKCLS